MSEQELERLAHPEFWDERYAVGATSADEPTHEWFRTFDELLPFLEPHLLVPRSPSTNPKIIHLGSGDSVGSESNDHPELVAKLNIRQYQETSQHEATRINYA